MHGCITQAAMISDEAPPQCFVSIRLPSKETSTALDDATEAIELT